MSNQFAANSATLPSPTTPRHSRHTALGWVGRALFLVAVSLLVIVTMAAQSAQAASTTLLNNFNSDPVQSTPCNFLGACVPATFTVAGDTRITSIQTYHWNGGRGAAPSAMYLREIGKTSRIGPFAAYGSNGNVNWTATPNFVIPKGTYAVEDSNPITRSFNKKSGYAGFSLVEGEPVARSTPVVTGGRPPAGCPAGTTVLPRAEAFWEYIGNVPKYTICDAVWASFATQCAHGAYGQGHRAVFIRRSYLNNDPRFPAIMVTCVP